MMQVTAFSLVAILNAVGGAMAGQYIFPPGLPDGNYATNGSVDTKTGFTTYTYLGPINSEGLDGDVEAVTHSTGLARRNPINCNGHLAGDSVFIAEKEFVIQWGGVEAPPGAFWTIVGSTIAYGCNSGGPQIVDGGVFLKAMASVDSICQGAYAGWFVNAQPKINYGRDQVNEGIC
ncbi:hypothetical protein GQ53DRAFT_801279 [Thozetella sp. PMI_491]|nr:hypothetical protein GQ53DRAFT_801279 [Thozetella sp. PMI_491]